MFRRIHSLLYFLLVFMLLSGCSEDGAVSETGTPPATEISSSQNNENSALDQNVERGVDMTEAGSQQNSIYLWKKDNIPTTTTYTENPCLLKNPG